MSITGKLIANRFFCRAAGFDATRVIEKPHTIYRCSCESRLPPDFSLAETRVSVFLRLRVLKLKLRA